MFPLIFNSIFQLQRFLSLFAKIKITLPRRKAAEPMVYRIACNDTSSERYTIPSTVNMSEPTMKKSAIKVSLLSMHSKPSSDGGLLRRQFVSSTLHQMGRVFVLKCHDKCPFNRLAGCARERLLVKNSVRKLNLDNLNLNSVRGNLINLRFEI